MDPPIRIAILKYYEIDVLEILYQTLVEQTPVIQLCLVTVDGGLVMNNILSSRLG